MNDEEGRVTPNPGTGKQHGRDRTVPDRLVRKKRKGEAPAADLAPLEVREAYQALRGHDLRMAELSERLTPEQVEDLIRPTRGLIDTLQNIALGLDTAGALRERVSAARTVLEWSTPRPAQSVEVRAQTVFYADPYATEPAVDVTPPASS